MKITVNNSVSAEISEISAIKAEIKKVLGRRKLKDEIIVNLIGDGLMKKLNLKFRKKDKTTDVLSFNLNESGILGEIYISYPKAKKQAKEYYVSMKDELRRLSGHGTLHLLGYTHKEMGKYGS